MAAALPEGPATSASSPRAVEEDGLCFQMDSAKACWMAFRPAAQKPRVVRSSYPATLTYTFTLRDDVVWTDGIPVTANDIKFTYDAINSDLVDTPRKSNIGLVEEFRVVDDYTLEINFHTLDCTALQNLTLGILPAHMYAEDFSDIMENPLNEEPTVTNGPFKFQEWVQDDHVTLVRNDTYYLGAPNLEGWIYRVFADPSAELAAFLAGEIDVLSVGPQYVSVIEGEIAKGSTFSMKKFFNDGYTYVGFNMADPENPEIGWVDAEGSEEQGRRGMRGMERKGDGGVGRSSEAR